MTKRTRKAKAVTQAKPAEKPETKAAPGAPPEINADLDDVARAELASFADGFLSDLPADMHNGSYGAHARDRWHDEIHAIPDGTHREGEFLFTFADGRFIGATALPPLVTVEAGPIGDSIQGDPLGR